MTLSFSYEVYFKGLNVKRAKKKSRPDGPLGWAIINNQ
jgi:hypothetical protein